MDTSILKGLVIGGIAATAVGAVAGYQVVESRTAYAEVLSVESLTRTERTPRLVCNEVTVSHKAPVKDPNRVTGTVVGALLGGAVGNQIGGGSGQKIATVAGAAAGGYAGNKVQQRMQDSNTYQATEQRCSTVYDRTEKPDGYQVRYRLRGVERAVHMDYDPGSRIPLKDGEPVLSRLGSVEG